MRDYLLKYKFIKIKVKDYILFYYLFNIINKKNILKNGDWGLGIGDWGLGIGPNPQSPIPNPQSPIPITLFYF